MKNIKLNPLYLMTAAVLTLSSTSAAYPTTSRQVCNPKPVKDPWTGFFVGGLFGTNALVGGKGTLVTRVNGTDETSKQDKAFFPIPYYTLTLGFNSQFSNTSTIAFEGNFDYGVLPKLRLSYGYLITPVDRLSFGVGVDVMLFSLALSGKSNLEVSSMYGFTPSISYERSIGNGGFFQARLNYNYLGVKGENLEKDFEFPTSVRRFVRDYWDKDVSTVKSVDASVHGVTLSLGFGYTF